MDTLNVCVPIILAVLCFEFNYNIIHGAQLNSTNNTTLQSNQIVKNSSNNTISASKSQISSNATAVNVAEGGSLPSSDETKPVDTTHMGREHIVENSKSDTMAISSSEIPQNLSVTPRTNGTPYEIPEKNDNKKSVPKKGVEFRNSTTVESSGALNSSIEVSSSTTSTTSSTSTTTSTTSTSTTTTKKPKHKKPTITEAGDELPPDKSNTKVPNSNIDLNDGNNRPTDYIVPIVAVILSVPLVAIVFSVLYKRGSEWWQHRHYRRMDFLIDGMYNN